MDIPITSVSKKEESFFQAAAFIYKFIQFIEWPSHRPTARDGGFVIGVYGDSPILESLQDLKEKASRGCRIKIIYLNNQQDMKLCHMLFIGRSGKSHSEEIIESLMGAGILAIREAEEFAQREGMIILLTSQGKIRFKINPEAAERGGLKISSKLLRLARVVQTRP